ncbi:MAG: hypothetical protein K0Q74_365, partial [Gammaproteobacteria bacterium]|nr:hypothetical protein [Gammaproteobacteria bacterium]
VKKEQDAAAQHDQAQPAEGSRRRASISFLPSASKGEDSSDVISQPRTRSLSL